METTATTLTNIQMLLMVERMMNALVERTEWDEATKKVYLSLHTAWHALIDANTLSVFNKETQASYTHPDSNAFITWD
jgi:hypothetical protein